ncbi:serine hydrolase domain-containing protein [Bacillus sp. JJ722]|uniref:serine hydrolase domain-containing protein n=1 Tax=Bacillus sp. JJ722 TaxID=3122973 RepID=UPI002FFD6E24
MKSIHSIEFQKQVEDEVKPFLKKRKHAIVAIGIVTKDDQCVLGCGDKGMYDVESYGDLLFEIGSITKIFTTSMLSLMMHDGLVSVKDSIGHYLLELSKEHPITLEHLATHSSGIPPKHVVKMWRQYFEKNSQRDPYCAFSIRELHHYLQSVTSVKRRKFRYSNDGLGLLGKILAHKLGMEYETAVIENICKPLDMPNTVIKVSSQQRKRLVSGYRKNNMKQQELVMKDFEGAGALRSNIVDMLQFLSAHMGVRNECEMHEKIISSQQAYIPNGKSADIGLGWLHDKQFKTIWHNGSTHGFSSFIGFRESRNAGVVVLTNYRTGMFGNTPLSMGFKVLDLLNER